MYHHLVSRILRPIPKCFFPISHFHTCDKTQTSESKLGFVLNQVEELQSLKPPQTQAESGGEEEEEEILKRNGHLKSFQVEAKVQISHPWPEWIDLMELLLNKALLEQGGGGGLIFAGRTMGTKDFNRVRTACLNLARDRFDLIRYFSRKDICVIMEYGCPSIDRKVVNSGKRLRAHVGMDEGKVCSVCSLRGSCERAYVKAREDEGGRTIDVMRILLTYGIDPINGPVENKPCLNRRVKESVRKLLSEMVEFSIREVNSDSPKPILSRRLSVKPEHSTPHQIDRVNVPMKQGDWICPKCDFINFAKNIKCLRCNGFFQERLRKLREHQDHLPLKKGDWICDKCNFLNFAKNTRCLQCEEKPPQRHLNPGEWECESCNYINFRKNMVCLKCDWKRPKASYYSSSSSQSQNEDRPQGMNFVQYDQGNDHPSVRQEGASFSKYMGEDMHEGDGPSLWNRFGDFPILGGKSNVSNNPQTRERWKREMSRKSRIVTREREDNDTSHPKLPKNSSSVEPIDYDMAEWFGYSDEI